MKKTFTLFLMAISFATMVSAQEESTVAPAEEAVETQSNKELKKEAKSAAIGEDYRRSSLALFMAEDVDMKMANVIKTSFLSSEMPEKYNDHNVCNRIFAVENIKITAEDKAAFAEAVARGRKSEAEAKTAAASIPEGTLDEESADSSAGEGKKKKAKSGGGGFAKVAGTAMRSTASEASGGAVNAESKEDVATKAYKYLCEQNVAVEMVKKWFTDAENAYSMELIKQRGLYDASAEAIEVADASFRGKAMLADAGEELIKNSFVVVSRYNYISKDELVAQIDAAAQLIASQIQNQYAAMAAKAATLAVKASLGAGYYVQTSSSLFQLEWNDEIGNAFYENFWDKPEAWNNAEATSMFKLNYIGTEKAWANVKAGVFTKKSEAELIKGATVNAMDNVLAKLSKKYEVFKTKTPLIVTTDENGNSTLTAKIGLKEGLSGGDKYEVLQSRLDKETNKTVYKKVGVIKVSKDQIWDNRYMADEERAITGDSQSFDATLFDGGKSKFYSGLLIRQAK